MKDHIRQTLFVFAGAVCLMIPAIYNRFPIAFSDTGTYLSSGFDMVFPEDRPITYGLFVRISSLNGYSLWLTIIAQSLILSFVLFLFIRMLTAGLFRYWIAGLIFLFIALFTSSGLVSSTVMADVFTPIGILTGAVVIHDKLRWGNLVILLLLFQPASQLLIYSALSGKLVEHDQAK